MIKMPEMIRIALDVYDIIQRADSRYVPVTTIERNMTCSGQTLRTVLARMQRGGLLTSIRGRAGGYTIRRVTTLRELFDAVLPDYWDSCLRAKLPNKDLAKLVQAAMERAGKIVISGKRLYVLGD